MNYRDIWEAVTELDEVVIEKGKNGPDPIKTKRKRLMHGIWIGAACAVVVLVSLMGDGLRKRAEDPSEVSVSNTSETVNEPAQTSTGSGKKPTGSGKTSVTTAKASAQSYPSLSILPADTTSVAAYLEDPAAAFEKYYAEANLSLKEALESVSLSFYNLGPGSAYAKNVLQLLDILPNNTPWISAEQAEKICDSLYLEDCSEEWFYETLTCYFDEIAGAPDYLGFSGGIKRIVYYLNAEHSEYIKIQYPAVGWYSYTEGKELKRLLTAEP